jgi:hypothetical protein
MQGRLVFRAETGATAGRSAGVLFAAGWLTESGLSDACW